MKIILHESKFRSLFSLGVSVVTESSFSHASIVDNRGIRWDSAALRWDSAALRWDNRGIRWDSAALRGRFGEAAKFSKNSQRRILVFDLPDLDLSVNHSHRFKSYRYDYVGVLFWRIGLHIEKWWFCFEAAKKILELNGIHVPTSKNLVSGKDLRLALDSMGIVGKYMRECDYGKV